MTAISDTEVSASAEGVVSHPPYPFWLGVIQLTAVSLFDASGTPLSGAIILVPSTQVYLAGWGVLEGSATLTVVNGSAAPLYIPTTDTAGTAFTYTIYQRLVTADEISPAPVTGVSVPHTLGPAVDISALL